jgi:hypothetical protein
VSDDVVPMPRALFERVMATLHNDFEPDNQCRLYKDLRALVGVIDDWKCGHCGKNAPEEWRVFGSCYRCAANKSVRRLKETVSRLRAQCVDDAVVDRFGHALWDVTGETWVHIKNRHWPYTEPPATFAQQVKNALRAAFGGKP